MRYVQVAAKALTLRHEHLDLARRLASLVFMSSLHQVLPLADPTVDQFVAAY
jgi:hypothetical protein